MKTHSGALLGCLTVAALLTSGACGRAPQNTEAVRQGVIKHLAGKAGLDVGSMQVDVSTLTFRDNEADALVSFRPKGSTDPGNAMQMKYTLERKGSEWVVKGKSESGGAPHGAAPPALPGMPQGHPPVSSEPAAPPAPSEKK
ncbi:MAG TPA: hypothetical protein DEH78_11625 [Solibacterales bacterium]|nr:hypothetical protein [Bryobacterales bacterium]